MNRLNIQDRAKILSCLVEGNSIRATARMTDTDKKTVLRLLADVGAACQAYHDKHVRNIKAQRVQTDEIWQFCYSRKRWRTTRTPWPSTFFFITSLGFTKRCA